MNSGMGTLLTDKTAFGTADLFPPSLDTTLNNVKTNIGALDLAALKAVVSRIQYNLFSNKYKYEVCFFEKCKQIHAVFYLKFFLY